MNNFLQKVSLLTIFAFSFLFTSAQSFTASWPFSTDTLSTVSGNVSAPGAFISSSLFTKARIYGISGLKGTGTAGKSASPACTATYNAVGTTTPITPYLELNCSPSVGNSAAIDSFHFTITGDSISSANMVFAAGYSTDGGITFNGFYISKNAATPAIAGTTGTSIATGDVVILSAPATTVAAGGTLTIRIIYWKNASGNTTGNRIILSAVNLTGSTSPATANPTISATPSTITGLSYIFGAGPSAEHTINISGTSLTNDILVTAPADYEITTTSGSGYAGSVNLTQTAGNVSNTPVYVRLKAGLAIGTYNETITVSSSGATNKTITTNGVVTTNIIPTLTTPSPSNLSGFIYSLGNGPSAEQSFTFSGQNLTDTVKISVATTSFEISLTSGTGFVGNTTGPLYVLPVGGVVPPTTVYARLKAGLAASASSYQNKKVTISSTGATSVLDTLSGVVWAPSIIVTATNLPGFSYIHGAGPSADQTFSVTGYLSSPIGIKAPADYEMSLTYGTGYTDSITLNQVNDTVPLTLVYVRLKAGLAIGNYDENIVLSGTGVVSPTILCNGQVISDVPVPTIDAPVPASLTGLNYAIGAGPSTEKTFTLSGINLSDNVLIAGATNYEISLTSGTGFGSTLSLTPTTGTLASTTVYVRLKSGLAVGVYNETLNITSTGATAHALNISGNVTDTSAGASFTASWPFLTDTLPTIAGNVTASGAIIDPTLFTKLRNYGVAGLKGQGTNGKATSPLCSVTYNSVGNTNPITPYMDLTMAPVAGYTAVLNPFSFTLTGDSISSANMLVAAGYSIDGGITYTGFALSKNGTPITPNPDSLGTPIATADIITFSAPAISLPANASLNFRIIYWKNASGATSGNRVILSPINITGSTTPVASCTVNNWTGAVSTAWEDAGNWSCGTVPTAVSEVHVNSGLTNYPIVNSSATCKKLYTSPGASVTITTGFTLDIVGHN